MRHYFIGHLQKYKRLFEGEIALSQRILDIYKWKKKTCYEYSRGFRSSLQSLTSLSVAEGLILFAAEDEGRTEEPTERRKRREREKGRVAKSQEIPSAVTTLGSLIVLFFLAGWLLSRIFATFRHFLGNIHEMNELTVETMLTVTIFLAKEMGFLLGPIFLVVVIMAIAGNVSQVGFLFTLKPLEFDFSRIKFTPANLIKKVLFSKQVGFNLIKTLGKVLLLGCVSYFVIYNDFISVLKTGFMGIEDALQTLGTIAIKLALILVSILFVISIPDYFYQKHEFIESIKMTKHEVKQELKETEGDPLIKQRQRQRAFEGMKRGMLTRVKLADVVITNPVHFAIALRYDPNMEDAPRVLAKGEDHLALIIKNLARRNEVPIVGNKLLARELYYGVSENDIVPQEFYRVLVDIFLNIEHVKDRFTAEASLR